MTAMEEGVTRSAVKILAMKVTPCYRRSPLGDRKQQTRYIHHCLHALFWLPIRENRLRVKLGAFRGLGSFFASKSSVPVTFPGWDKTSDKSFLSSFHFYVPHAKAMTLDIRMKVSELRLAFVY
jgi:hypothetical protein